MNRLKGKVEAYVVSTMEDNQRDHLMDNLTMSVEKIEEEAEKEYQENGEKTMQDNELVDNFCECILAILEHELKVLQTKQKPSFWIVAESITPRDTVKMIYRLNIKQTDNNRCHAWVRHTLKEGTIGSFMSMLVQDNRKLKEFYKQSAFVRDSAKIQSALNLINCIISTIHFVIFTDQFSGNNLSSQNRILPEIPQENSSRNINIKRRKKQPANIAMITDTSDEFEGYLSSSVTSNTSINYVEEFLKQKLDQCEINVDEKQQGDQDNILDHLCDKQTGNNSIQQDNSDQNTDSNPPEHNTNINGKQRSWTLEMDSISQYNVTGSETLPEMSKNSNSSHDSVNTNDNTTKVREAGDNVNSFNFNNCDIQPQDESSLSTSKDSFSNSTLKLSQSLNHSETSPFQIVHPSPKSTTYNIHHSQADKSDNSFDNSNLFDSTDKNIQPNLSGESTAHLECHDNTATEEIYTQNSDVYKEDIPSNELSDEMRPSKINENEEDLADAFGKKTMLLDNYGDFNDDDVEQEDQTDKQSLCDSSIDTLSEPEHDIQHEITDFDEYSSESTVLAKKQFEGRLTNDFQLSTSGSFREDYYIPGIHKSPDPELMQLKTNDLLLERNNTRQKDLASLRNNSLKNDLSSVQSHDKSTLARKTGNSESLSSSFHKTHSGSFISDTDSDSCSTSDTAFSILADLGINDDFIGMKEDHFSTPDSFMGFSSNEELENAISTCKQLIKQSPEKSVRRNDLVQQLIQLRLKLHEMEEKTGEEEVTKNVKKVLGHHFMKQEKVASSIPCDSCSSLIYPMFQSVFMCRDCGFHCHRKCLKTMDKACVFTKNTVNETYRMQICPEMSLSEQQYRCADCLQRFTHSDGRFQMRLCDYSGQHYCHQCHWNEQSIIPARVIHNWDFKPQKVSRQAKQILQLRHKKPDINLQELNPALFNFVDELRSVRKLREDLIMMKEYMRTCRIATENRMLLQLMNRHHFVDNSTSYSMEDLIDIHSNVLVNELNKKFSLFAKHIKQDCQLCIGKGYICENCQNNEIIFPFDNNVVRCPKCSASFHRSCYTTQDCPKCERTAIRRHKSLVEEEIV